MSDVFTHARTVLSSDVAARAGLSLRRRGARSWACCPLHGEKTPSLCFYPDGRWYCFGCHQGGDAVDLHAALHHVDKLEAAKALSGGCTGRRRVIQPQRKTRPSYLSEADEDGFTWDRLCAIRTAAMELIATVQEDSPRLWNAVAAKALAEERLDNIITEEQCKQVPIF